MYSKRFSVAKYCVGTFRNTISTIYHFDVSTQPGAPTDIKLTWEVSQHAALNMVHGALVCEITAYRHLKSL